MLLILAWLGLWRVASFRTCTVNIMAAAGPRSSGGGGPAGSDRDRDPDPERDPDRERERERASFECNICLDTARDAVISLCGHLFW